MNEPVPQSDVPVRRTTMTRTVTAIGLVVAVLLIAVAPRVYKSIRTRSFDARCQLAREAKDWRTLRQTAGEWVKWDPQSARGWLLAAVAAQEQEDLEDLTYCLGQVPRDDEKALISYLEKANLEWTVLNRPLDGLKTSQQILEIDPHILEVHSRIISFYAMNLQRAPMLKAIRTAIDVGAEPREVYAYLLLADLLSFTNGGDLNSRWLASAPDEVRFKIGLGVHTAMNLAMSIDNSRTEDTVALNEEADRQLKWFLEQEPHDPVLLTYLMYRAYQSSDFNRVAELLQNVDERGIDDHMVWVFRAWYHTLTEEFGEAEKAIQEALRLHPISPLAHHEYANLLRRLGKPEVEREQTLAGEGRELRSLLLRLPAVTDIDADLLERIRAYAEKCGDSQVADALGKRLLPQGAAGPPRPIIKFPEQ